MAGQLVKTVIDTRLGVLVIQVQVLHVIPVTLISIHQPITHTAAVLGQVVKTATYIHHGQQRHSITLLHHSRPTIRGLHHAHSVMQARITAIKGDAEIAMEMNIRRVTPMPSV